MICTTIQHKDLEGILAVLETEKIALAEIRLDRTPCFPARMCPLSPPAA